MIFTLKIEKHIGGYDEEFQECIRIIEIDGDSDLETLHYAIQDSVDFDDDHLYEFFVADSIRSRQKTRYDDENEGIWENSIKDLYPLKKHKKIFYLFDYGSSWYFRILRTKDQPKEREKGVKYPRLIKSIGKNPLQYDEEWED